MHSLRACFSALYVPTEYNVTVDEQTEVKEVKQVKKKATKKPAAKPTKKAVKKAEPKQIKKKK